MMNPDKLRGKIVENGYSCKTFSDAIGIGRTALYRKLNGTTEFSRSEIQAITTVLHLTSEQLLDIFFGNKVS